MREGRGIIACIPDTTESFQFLNACVELGLPLLLLVKSKWLDSIREYPWQYLLIEDFSSEKEIIEKVTPCNQENTFIEFISFGEAQVELTAKLNNYFNTKGLGVEAAALFRDKYLMKSKAEELGIAVPAYSNYEQRHQFYSNLDSGKEFLVKPRKAWGCQGIVKFSNMIEAEKHLDTLENPRDYMLEELAPQEMYHVGGLISDNKTLLTVVVKHDTPILDLGSDSATNMIIHTIDQNSDLAESLRVAHDKIARGFEITRGLTFMEFFCDPDGKIMLCEAAARHPALQTPKLYELITGRNFFYEYAHLLAKGELSCKELSKIHKYAGLINFAALPGKIVSVDNLEDIDDPQISYRYQQPNLVGKKFDSWSFKNTIGRLIINANTEQDCINQLLNYNNTFKYACEQNS